MTAAPTAPERTVRNRGDLGATVVLAIVAGALVFQAVQDPSMFKYALAGCAILVVTLVHPRWYIYLTIVFAFFTFPAAVAFGRDLGLFTILPYEVAAIIALLVLLRDRVQVRPIDVIPALCFLGMVAAAAFHGHDVGNDSFRIAREVQFLFDTVLGYFYGLVVVRAGLVSKLAKVCVPVLWGSAAMIAIASVTGLVLEGRADDLAKENAAESGIRYITNVQMAATAVLCVGAACFLLKLPGRRFFLWAIPPTLFIILMSFSRNTIIGLAVTLAVCVVFGGTLRTLPRAAALAAGGTLGIVGATSALLFLGQGTPVGKWLSTTVESFQGRVLGGVSAQYLATDNSLNDRLVENSNLMSNFTKEPWFGHGAGFAYKSHFGTPRNFVPAPDSSYAHNFYLWWLVKAGVIGMVFFVAFALIPLYRALRSRRRPAIAAAAISTALMAISVVAPLPLDPANSLLFGMALGAAAGYSAVPRTAVPPGIPPEAKRLPPVPDVLAAIGSGPAATPQPERRRSPLRSGGSRRGAGGTSSE
ncbi:O-antigen ligase domain-containing protein [Tsukamurella tyrosinosolvens]|nr:O-antigen ligase domain-containing protein [Tsukamurella tyrosinosolvens]